MTAPWHDENEQLAVTIFADASAVIHVKATGARWHMSNVALQEDNPIEIGHVWLRTTRSICEEFPGRFRGESHDDQLRFTLLGREQQPLGQFTVAPRLDGPWLDLRISEIDAALPSLVFPPPIESESLVLPQGVGRWVREPLPERHVWVYPAHLNMRWFGGLRGDDGWLAMLSENEADAGVLATGLSAAPVWLQSLGRWQSFRVRYGFTTGGYVGLARTFRAADSSTLARPLRAKIEETPALGNLLGGRMLSFMQASSTRRTRYEDRLRAVPPGVTDQPSLRVFVSHAQARAAIQQARSLGMERGMVNLRGWIAGGYDESHPDIWPPEPALGTLDELRALLALPDPLLTVLHDNYQDSYQQAPSWPRGVIRGPRGELMPGGQWAGGQAYILNARDGLGYARRNWEQLRTLAPRGMFIDTTTAVQLYQSYEPGNELERAHDLLLKRELLRFYKEQGQVLGSEEGADWGVPFVDWIENRHQHVPGQSIPLWPLVYHDAVFNLRYGESAPEQTMFAPSSWLPDLLWGYPLLWAIKHLDQWRAEQTAFTASLPVDRWIARIGTEDMRDHRYLSEDSLVEQTTFESAAVVVNFADEPRTVDGLTIPAHGWIIRD